MTDEDLRAFGPAAAPAVRPRRRLWPWLLGALALAVLLATAGAVAALWSLLQDGRDGVQVVLDGQPWEPAPSGLLAALLALLGVGGALCAGLLAVVLVVPLAVGLALLGVALGLGLAALALVAVLAMLLSPLWLLVLLLWWMLRSKPAPAAATMRA